MKYGEKKVIPPILRGQICFASETHLNLPINAMPHSRSLLQGDGTKAGHMEQKQATYSLDLHRCSRCFFIFFFTQHENLDFFPPE